jgi:hypothetical protein
MDTLFDNRGQMKVLSWLLFSALPALAWAGETGYATRELELRAQPVAGAAIAGKVPAGQKFEIVGEEKAWVRVQAGPVSGWTLLFYVMKGEPGQGVNAGRTASELWNLGTDRSKGQITSTIGIRGIDEEQLKAAHFNGEELKRLESQLVAKDAGDAFAREGGLEARKVADLPEPAQ